MSYDSTILAEASLTNYYTLNSDGTDSKSALNGTVTGGSFSNAGGCIDGSNCWTTTGSGTEQIVMTAGILPTSGDFCIEFALNVTSGLGSSDFIWVASTANAFNGVYLRNTSVIQARNNSSPSNDGGFAVAGSGWHLYQISYSPGSTTAKLYKDGTLVSTNTSDTISQTSQTTSGFIRTTNGVNMRMQKAAFYNAQLSQAQVTAHYTAFTVNNLLLSGTGAQIALTGGNANLQVNSPIYGIGAQIAVTPGNAQLNVNTPLLGSGAQVAVTPGNASMVINNPFLASGAKVSVTPGSARFIIGGGGGDTGGIDIISDTQSVAYGILTGDN